MHAEWMIFVGSVFLVLSYILIPRKPYLGWVASLTGNLLYLYPVSTLHRFSLMIAPVVFTALSLWNVCRHLSNQHNSLK